MNLSEQGKDVNVLRSVKMVDLFLFPESGGQRSNRMIRNPLTDEGFGTQYIRSGNCHHAVLVKKNAQ